MQRQRRDVDPRVAFVGDIPHVAFYLQMQRFCLAVLAVVVLTGCDQKVIIHKFSAMEPTIRPDERIQVQMNAYRSLPPQRWDVVVFTPPMRSVPAGTVFSDLGIWTFRIVGTPGDIITFDDTQLLINGSVPSDRPSEIRHIQYKKTTAAGVPERWCSPTYPLTIPEGQYFVLGDNPDHANDSRSWGLLPRERILGKVAKK